MWRCRLVPREGKCDTDAGESLRASTRLAHDYLNNGGGNNVSGPFFYLKEFLPEWKSHWSRALLPYVTGSGGNYCSNVQFRAVEEILDCTVQHVLAMNGHYAPNENDCFDLNVRSTGFEISEGEAEMRREELLERNESENYRPRFQPYPSKAAAPAPAP